MLVSHSPVMTILGPGHDVRPRKPNCEVFGTTVRFDWGAKIEDLRRRED